MLPKPFGDTKGRETVHPNTNMTAGFASSVCVRVCICVTQQEGDSKKIQIGLFFHGETVIVSVHCRSNAYHLSIELF